MIGVVMPVCSRALWIFLAVLLLIQFTTRADAQASRKTLSEISQLVLRSYKLLSEEKDTEAARDECEKAQAIEQKSEDAFVSATVHVCFGDVADYEQDAEEACRHYAAALKDFRSVPAKHSARRTLKTHINVTQGKRLTLGCSS
jgi:hypothetical protein